MPALSRSWPSQAGFCPVAWWHGVTELLRPRGARRPVEQAAPAAVAKQSEGRFYCLLVLVELGAVSALEELPRRTTHSRFYRSESLPAALEPEFGPSRVGAGLGLR